MMVLRKLAIALLGLGVMLPGLSHALTVGPGIDVKSALGEPFHGQVALSDLGDLSADDVKVMLATQEDFDRFGIQKAYFLTDLRFSVIINPSGGSYIDVVSSRPVDEPVLDFVIHVSWPGNDKLNDVVALLDPPVQAGASTSLSQAQTPVVTPVAPTVIASSSPQAAASVPSAAPAPEALPARPAAAYRHGRRPRTPEDTQAKPAPATHEQASGSPASSYDVHSGDTLWVIAEKVRPSDSVTVSQTMIALQKKNPDSFSNSNINQLKSGETLDVPSESQIRDVSAEQALASVREQNKAWRGMTGQSSKPAKLEAQQVDATAKPQAAPKPAAGPSKAEMKLLAQEGSGKNASGSAGAEAKGVSKTDAKKLKENKLKADAAKKDNEKLASKVGTLDNQVKANDKQLAVQNAKLAELQAQLKEQAAKAAAKSAPAPVAAPAHVATAPAPVAASAPAVPAAMPAASALAASGAPEGVVASAAASAPKLASKHLPETTVAPPPAETEDSGLPLGLIGAAGAAVVALFGGFMFMSKRKKQKQAEALDALDGFDDHAAHGGDTPDFAAADADESTGFTDDHEAYRNADLGSLEPSGLTAEVPMFRDTPAADPLDEVEQYLAYERYPQAVGFLNKAIAAQPERTDLRLKLMEIYVRLQDTHGFEEQEAALADSSDLGVLARIEELKSSLPELPKKSRDEGVIDYAPTARKSMGSTDDSLPSLEELEMDFNATVSASNPNLKALDDTQLGAAAIPSASSEELLDFNFDSGGALEDHDFTFQPEATTKSVVEPAPAPVMDSGLSFTLDEPEPVEAPVSNKAQQGRDIDVSGMSLGDGIEMADFETAPELAEPEVHTSEADLNFSLDDLDMAAPAAPANELHDALDGDFSLEESAASSADADEVKLDHVMAESGLNDMAALFDDALAEHQASSAQAPAAAPAPAPVAAPAPTAVNMTSPGLGIDDEFDFLADTDENATKLDLAKAYIDMGDMEGAKDILNEVLSEGNSGQKDEAKTLLAQVG
jgi:pilus assembly protein FimV